MPVSQKKKTVLMSNKLIVIGLLLIFLIIFFLILIINNKSSVSLVDDLPDGQIENLMESGNINTEDDIFSNSDNLTEVVDNLDSATNFVPGASLITEDGVVVNNNGNIVQNNAIPMTDLAPSLSEPISPDELTTGAIKLIADENGFSPKEFTVKEGEVVTLSLTSVNLGSRLVFEDKSLSALELPVPAGYTMAKTFNAPESGRYVFFQDMPNRNNQNGLMVVIK